MPAFLLFACCLPPFDGLYDRWFSHKWYAVGFAVMLLLLWTAWRSQKGRALHLPSARAVSVSALAVLAYCLAYTFVTDIQPFMLRGFDSFPVHGMFDNATGLSLNLCLADTRKGGQGAVSHCYGDTREGKEVGGRA